MKEIKNIEKSLESGADHQKEHEKMRYKSDKAPDCIYPSDNDYDIPSLRLDMQADALDLPLVSWGRLNRSALRKCKSVHFYTEDRYFSSLWSTPDLLLHTEAVTAVEVNYSLGNQVPYWVGVQRTGQKRHMSRYWQEKGVKIWVDLNVGEKFKELNMIGVPLGWGSFAFRGYNGNTKQDILDAFILSESWANGEEVRFLLYGGGLKEKELARRHGWIWIPEDAHVYEHRRSHKDVQMEQGNLPVPLVR